MQMKRKDDEPRPQAHSLRELGAKPNRKQFVVWADLEPRHRAIPIALVDSDGYYTSMDGDAKKHTDRWGLVPIFF